MATMAAVPMAASAAPPTGYLSPVNMRFGARQLLKKMMRTNSTLDGRIFACEKVSYSVGVCNYTHRFLLADYAPGEITCAGHVRVISQPHQSWAASVYGTVCN
jgi:hypothetical protein